MNRPQGRLLAAFCFGETLASAGRLARGYVALETIAPLSDDSALSLADIAG